MAKMRIATVKATGDRYLVQRLEIPTSGEGRCHVWGEVTGFHTARAATRDLAMARTASTKHQASKTFPRGAVDVSEEVEITGNLAQGLLDQAARNLKFSTRTRRTR